MTDTDELIETLERLEKEATPGPWKHKKSVHGNKYRYVEIGDEGTYTTLELEPGDARLIAALRNHLPALISALKENKRLREDVKVAQYQAWETAIRCASNTVGLFPNDTKESLHRFGAETVLRALLHVRAQCLDTAALQPQGDK